ncbi:acyl-CoA dehydrogenase family protein [Piscinibacter sp. XHJ-5]|uniref:acyl-CoA dehydrogenase family protein n=1 Tax=Piscinibacter sp. XHJ-5 TaxID=3037797 RepID=UPI002453346C|nr:acyl-CoA dehydrogenase family protein [Piscinibacter sp. XHJ-5]
MDFDFTDDQEMLRDSVRKWVDKGYDFERRRAIVKQGGFSREAWGELAGLGLTGLHVAEAHGGMGFGPVDAMVVMEELGRGLVLEPFAQGALIAGKVLSQAPQAMQAAWLPKIAGGEALVVLAHQERGARYRLNHVATAAKGSGASWTVSGAKSIVPVGDQADAFIVPARVSGAVDDAAGVALFLVERSAAGVATRGYPTQDGARAAEVTLNDAPAALIVPAGEGFGALERAVDVGIAAVCAEAVGAMDKLVALTVEYMNTRKQFGVPIATFQALRHRIADVKMQLELGRSMSYYASLKLDDAPEQRRRALSQAKLQLGQSMRFVGQQCIQLHGGIGVTDEYIGSHYFKRLTVMEMTFGDTMHHTGEVSRRMQETAGVFG